MRYFTVLAGALALAACGMFGSEKPLAKGPLDNKTFAAQMVRDGKSEPVELVFNEGTFRSSAADRQGFTRTNYTAVKQGEFMKFEAVASSPKSGTMQWQGTVRGETIEGTAVWDEAWYRPDREYRFKGKLKD
ncbi:MAG TPA: hypothetical protein VGC54_07100 [Planctomycetota bacterium]|jgi:hypothetical protein